MRFFIENEEYSAAAEELASVGIETGKGGIPTRITEGEKGLRISLEGGMLAIGVSKRVQAFYALKLVADADPCGDFFYEGEPAFDDLTYMLDCSRNAVPKPETVESLIRHLAVMGYDSLGLYLEDTLVLPGYPYFGYLRDPYTKEDIVRLDSYCAKFGIRLVPYIQTLAHFNSLTRHYAMGHLFDTGDILLVGEEETYKFLEALIATCADCFSSRDINIGMDEAAMLGRGVYLDRNGYRPRFDIMKEHLERVLAICKKYGFKPMMWSDMFYSLIAGIREGESPAGKIPEGVELIYWDYYETNESHYAKILKEYRTLACPLGFAGGAWKWLGYTPDNRFSFVSCEMSARACIKEGIRRYIVTGWGDNGAECSPFATLPALLYCARINYGMFGIDGRFKAAFSNLTGVSYDDFITVDLCNRVTAWDNVEEKNSANKYLLFNDVLLGTLDTTVCEGLGALYRTHARKLRAAKGRTGAWSYLFETQYALARVLSYKADLGIKLRRAYREGNRAELIKLLRTLKVLPSEIENFYRALRRQWERENRVNGFDVQDIRIGALKQRIYVARNKLSQYLAGETDCIPELEEELLDHMAHGKEFETDPDQCEWRWRRMTSVNVNE